MSSILIGMLILCSFGSRSHGQSWKLIFEDQFSGTSLDESNWTPTRKQSHSYPYELEAYLSSQVEVSGGNLVLTLKYDPYYDSSTGTTYPYRSGVVTSSGKFSATYGKWEVRAKLPTEDFKHAWPAIWFQKQSGSCYQEIDLMEQWIGEYNNQVKTSYHFNPTSSPSCGPEYSQSVVSYPPSGESIDFSQDFHIWEMIWNTTMVVFYIDNNMIGKIDTKECTIPYQPAYIIMNIAVCGASYCGGTSGIPTDVTGKMYVDYVKVYQAD